MGRTSKSCIMAAVFLSFVLAISGCGQQAPQTAADSDKTANTAAASDAQENSYTLKVDGTAADKVVSAKQGTTVYMALLYGFILDTWSIVGFVSNANAASVLATYAAGLANNVASAIGTVVFLVPIAGSWPRIFGRIRERYLT